MWVFKLHWRANFFPQRMHSCGLSPTIKRGWIRWYLDTKHKICASYASYALFRRWPKPSWTLDQETTEYMEPWKLSDKLVPGHWILQINLPEWSRTWFFRFVCLLNPLWQISHLKGQDPLWTYMWLRRSPGVGKDLEHRVHLWGFSW